jgi:L-asparaginase/Glu-tRNA(Gln) amidotransferase subunit D
MQDRKGHDFLKKLVGLSFSDITPEAALAKLAYVLEKNELSHDQKRKENTSCRLKYIRFITVYPPIWC